VPPDFFMISSCSALCVFFFFTSVGCVLGAVLGDDEGGGDVDVEGADGAALGNLHHQVEEGHQGRRHAAQLVAQQQHAAAGEMTGGERHRVVRLLQAHQRVALLAHKRQPGRQRVRGHLLRPNPLVRRHRHRRVLFRRHHLRKGEKIRKER
jgi:hypothetical protein